MRNTRADRWNRCQVRPFKTDGKRAQGLLS